MTTKNGDSNDKDKKTTTNKANALRRRSDRRKNRGNAEVADWGSVDSEAIVRLIETVTGNKGTITFGYTRDGGAYYINYYFDGESEKMYIRPSEDIDKTLAEEVKSFV